MKLREIDKLQNKYPELFHSYSENRNIECGDGWYDLLDTLLELINDHNESEKTNIKIELIKQKFGTLRVYINGGHDKHIYGLINFAEKHSSKICELCGARGSSGNFNNYFKILCNNHIKEIKGDYDIIS